MCTAHTVFLIPVFLTNVDTCPDHDNLVLLISAIYDKCIFKFDHYCAWTNNCVGGLNHRYFFGYLATISAMCVNGVVMATKALVSITMRYQLLALRYVDDHGKPQPMTFRVLIQVGVLVRAVVC